MWLSEADGLKRSFDFRLFAHWPREEKLHLGGTLGLLFYFIYSCVQLWKIVASSTGSECTVFVSDDPKSDGCSLVMPG